MSEEAALVLTKLGAGVKTFNPTGLPLPDDAEPTHPKITELRDFWSVGVRQWFGAHLRGTVQ